MHKCADTNEILLLKGNYRICYNKKIQLFMNILLKHKIVKIVFRPFQGLLKKMTQVFSKSILINHTLNIDE